VYDAIIVGARFAGDQAVSLLGQSDSSPVAGPSDGRPPGSWLGYFLTVAGGTLGGMLGVAFGFLLASRIKGDPSAGMANVALIGAAILLVAISGAVGVPTGAYVALRLRREAFAGATAVMLLILLIPIGWIQISGAGLTFPFAWVLILPAACFLSRLIALRFSIGGRIDRIAVVGFIGLAWFFAILPSTRSFDDLQESRLKSTSFQLFEAAQLPSGQELTLVYTDTSGERPWVKLEYGSAGDRVMLIQYRDFGRYNPPTSCGPSYPGSPEDDRTQECQKVYTTAQGHEVFRSLQSSTAYLRIGSTIVTTSWGQEGVTKILDSLRPVAKEALLEKGR